MAYNTSMLTKKYFTSLPNKELHRQKCVVLFSGAPGSGKSHIARAIEQRLGAIRITNDDIRDLIAAENADIKPDERERTKLSIATDLLGLLETSPNGLVVFDASCDRPGGYEFYRDWADKHDYPVVLLRMDTPREILEQRIRQRSDTEHRNAAEYLAHLEVWWEEWKAFGKRQKPDMIIMPDTPIEEVFGLIERTIP